MHYEINVSLKGVHLFGTHERSITTQPELIKLYKLFDKKFPERHGYKLTVSKFPDNSFIMNNLDIEYIIKYGN